jgi:histidyl-tRNA synthetase
MLLSQREILKHGKQGKITALENMREILATDTDFLEEVHTPNQQDKSQTQQILDVLLDSTRYGTTMGGRSRHDIAQRLLNKSERGYEAKQIHAALDFFADWVNLCAPIDAAFSQITEWIGDDAEGQAILKNWQQTIQLLERYGIDRSNIIIQADLTKNWEYYTGIVFGVEVEDDNYIVGGGRYDELTRVLGSDRNIPAIGFAYYVDTMLPLMTHNGEPQQCVVLMGDNLADVILWAKFLRDNQIAVIIDTAPKDGTVITIENNRACLKESSFSFNERQSLLKDLKAI